MADATERLTLAASAFVAGCLLISRLQWVSALAAWGLSAGLFVWHWRRSKREARRAPPDAEAQGDGGAEAPAAPHNADRRGRVAGEPPEAGADKQPGAP